MTGYLTFPYQIDTAGHTATSDLAEYVEALVRLVLETSPGERVNRPTFGAGLENMLFEGLNSALAAAAETLIRGKIVQFLGDVLTIDTLTTQASGESLTISLTYTINASAEQTTQIVTQSVPGISSGSTSGDSIGAVPDIRVAPR